MWDFQIKEFIYKWITKERKNKTIEASENNLLNLLLF